MSEENIPSENSKNEILNSKQEEVTKNISQQETIEQTETQPKTENMEVHHHPHVEKKNFKEYCLEFIMIFLAVTMGFFAENIREHFVNKEKEIKTIATFKNELQKDTARLNSIINVYIPAHNFWTDSAIKLINANKLRGNEKTVFRSE